MFDKYDLYIEELLLAQYRVSEMIDHKLTRGEMREDFIKHQVALQYEQLSCYKGVVADANGENQSGQIDFLVPKPNARKRRMGDHFLFSVNDLSFVMEVKSNATGTDFTELNQKAESYKAMEGSESLNIGMFCYYYNLKMKNLLKRFGWGYDAEIQSYQPLVGVECEYPYIDFVIALDDTEEDERKKCFFLMKDPTNQNTPYMLYQDHPVSKYFFRLMSKNLT